MNDLIKPQTKKPKKKKKALQGDGNQICVVWLLKLIIQTLVVEQTLEIPTSDFQKQWGLRVDEHLVTFLVSSREIRWWGWGGPGSPG